MTTNDDTEGLPGPTGTGARDARLVAEYLAGDRSALGAIYDRHGASLFDTAAAMTGSRDDAADMVQDVFVLAAERLGQLRDPTRLRPWLFAILRNEVYRRSRRRSRSVVTDFSEPGREIVIPPTPSETERIDDELDAEELAELVRGAARGLDARDQLVLELSVRQGLTGSDLADALGVSPQQGYGLVHRMRERTERSLGAYCVARRGRRDCDELAGILAGWDGEFSVLLRKRVARHIEACSTCERTRRRFLPLGLIGAAPAFAAPIGLRDRIMEQVLALDSAQASSTGRSEGGSGIDPANGFPLLDGAGRAGRRLLAFVAGTAAVSLIAVGGLLVSGDGGQSATIRSSATDIGDVIPTDETSTTPVTTAATVVPTTETPIAAPTTESATTAPAGSDVADVRADETSSPSDGVATSTGSESRVSPTTTAESAIAAAGDGATVSTTPGPASTATTNAATDDDPSESPPNEAAPTPTTQPAAAQPTTSPAPAPVPEPTTTTTTSDPPANRAPTAVVTQTQCSRRLVLGSGNTYATYEYTFAVTAQVADADGDTVRVWAALYQKNSMVRNAVTPDSGGQIVGAWIHVPTPGTATFRAVTRQSSGAEVRWLITDGRGGTVVPVPITALDATDCGG